MKRVISVLLLAVMLVGMLSMAGCNSSKRNSRDFVVPEGGYDGSAVTIRFYNTMGDSLRTVLNQYIAEFNKLYPNITVDISNQAGGYDDVRNQINNEITVGNQPNIAYCYPDHVAMYNLANAVIQLDNLIASEVEVKRADGTTEKLGLTAEQIADFIPGYYNEGKCYGDDKMYTMPMSKSTEVLYYNKTFFEQNGIQVPTTWDELEAVCKKIKELDPVSIPLGYDSEANWFITMCEQYGSPYTSASGEHYLFDNETNRNFVKRFREWYKKGYLTTQEIYGAYTSGLFTNIPNEESPVRSYMSIGSTGGASHQRPVAGADGQYPFEVGIAPVPQVNPEQPKAISQGPSLCIFGKENPQEVIASWLFVKFLTTDVEFQAEFSIASGYVPVIQSVKENPVYAEWLSKADGGNYITALSCKVALEHADSYYVSPAFNGSSTARDQVGLLLQKCLVDSGTDADAFIKKAFADAVTACKESSWS